MYQLHHYLDMMLDTQRMGPLEAAVRSVVRAGDVILDLGAGTGVLTFIALDAGAAHVYALERSSTIEVARRVARANGLAEQITFIHGDATMATPSRLVDGIVGDVRGILPLLEDNIELFETVRRRWLKPGGYTVPFTDELMVAPVSATGPRAFVDGWSKPRREADYGSVAEVAANGFCRTIFQPEDILASGQPIGSVKYGETTPRKLAASLSFVMTRTGTLTGLGLWFRSVLAPGVSFDSSPDSPESVYGQAFFPLRTPRSVSAGETIEVTMTAHRTPAVIWGWQLSSAREPVWKESHSTFKSYLFDEAGLELLAGAKLPTLNEEGLVARHVLATADGALTARQIAERIAAAFPSRFTSPDAALRTVMKVLHRYTAP